MKPSPGIAAMRRSRNTASLARRRAAGRARRSPGSFSSARALRLGRRQQGRQGARDARLGLGVAAVEPQLAGPTSRPAIAPGRRRSGSGSPCRRCRCRPARRGGRAGRHAAQSAPACASTAASTVGVVGVGAHEAQRSCRRRTARALPSRVRASVLQQTPACASAAAAPNSRRQRSRCSQRASTAWCRDGRPPCPAGGLQQAGC